MPHTNRRKNNKPTKLRQIDDDDGWTTVARAKDPAQARKMIAANKVDGRTHGIRNDVTLKDLQNKYEVCLRNYNEECHEEVRKVLGRTFFPTTTGDEGGHAPVKITNAVCLALGTFTWYRDLRNMWQLAFFVGLIKSLTGDRKDAIQMSAQDPEFADVDVKFLESIGIKVYPMEELPPIYNQTFLFIPFMDCEVEYKLMHKAKICPLYVSVGVVSVSEHFSRFPRGQRRDTQEDEDGRQEALEAVNSIKRSHDDFEFPWWTSSGTSMSWLRMHVIKPALDNSET
ncbi:hypothetical protein B9Z65_4239 [Elsinoe australis]|uniref:SRR1-like domain-containing protein n=1 Tax=Elsinoe australis TaxID=40998 RepID=A0A2P7Z282_9PEZI|nr:hypothetical protein B9Z65_4239 [Elsinoe australis]